ncbi:MAG: SGNH/GDSL hydrolase family protein [Parasporobacterium sp.]|nr:SGNH/GDSL hydrolase family protein [Parasporobacterium sp.]
MNLKNLKINFLGDSITEGHGTSSEDHVFWRLLSDRDQTVSRGYGIGGTRIARQANPSKNPKHDLYFGSRADQMDPDADVVVVFGGTNDYGHGDAPMGRMEDRTEDTFFGALHCLCLSLLKRYPSSRIIFMTPLHRKDENRPVNEFGVRNVGTLGDYAEAVRKVAAYYAMPVLDLYSCSGINPDVDCLRKRYAPDGLHPNDAGHEKIYQALRSFLIAL